MTETALHENPLIPNTRLRQMFVAMAEMRVLDEHLASLQRGAKSRRQFNSTLGEEACRVSTAIGLEPGDLVSDIQAGVGMGLVLGEKVDLVMRQVREITSNSKKHLGKVSTDSATRRLLPWIEDVEDRLRMAMGAALSFKALKRPNLVVAYVRHGEVSGGRWKQLLKIAGKLEVPILFVVLPVVAGHEKKRGQTNVLSAKARSCKVPGIPVDASDAVALYRVAQESIGRMRGGGGPVLIECVASSLKGELVDPLVQMRTFLLNRKICNEAWLNLAGGALRRQILASKK